MAPATDRHSLSRPSPSRPQTRSTRPKEIWNGEGHGGRQVERPFFIHQIDAIERVDHLPQAGKRPEQAPGHIGQVGARDGLVRIVQREPRLPAKASQRGALQPRRILGRR